MNDPSHRDDEWSQLLESIAQQRCKTSFAQFFNHFSPLLKGFLIKGSRLNHAQAEELVQEVMIKVWQRAGQFDAKKSSASTWLYTIARNSRIDWLRRQANAVTEELAADDLYEDETSETPFSLLQHHRQHNSVHDALAGLPDEQALVLRKVYMEGLSHSEVSEDLALPLGTVKSRVRLALKKLQDVIGREVLA
ncbi:sigma-70 family RNA polymerase sigma factor [Simiduia litorea]|uniref:sigma-70 family RNA polymerase sigma factor n=1 Tax=Simiduia litorea TaxID=1435348 RepID=UPI0036F447E9